MTKVDLRVMAAAALLVALLQFGADLGIADVGKGDPGLTAAQQRGREIYRNGIGSSDTKIQALLSGTKTSVPATLLTCANCHGRDGRGVPEGGVVPSNLTWEVLTKPYVVKARTGRERVAYTERLIRRAIGMGIDSSGNQLDVAMPRYQMAQEDADDLLAYLRVSEQILIRGFLPIRLSWQFFCAFPDL